MTGSPEMTTGGQPYCPARQDIPAAAAALAAAFRNDPVWTWAIGDSKETVWQATFEIPLRYCHRYGEVWAVLPEPAGVAAWVSSELADMPIGRILLSGAIWPAMRIGTAAARRMQPLFDRLAASRRQQMANRRHFYLLAIGVAPAYQGQGLAGKLLRLLIAQASAQNRPVYLETEAGPNIHLYEHFGFCRRQEITLPLPGCSMVGMVREPA